jgi:hypothetical protein
MARRPRAGQRHPPATSSPRDGGQVDERLRSGRLEILLQAEALVARAMSYAMRVGYGDERYWAGRVTRTDRFEMRIADEAVELATERISMACKQIGAEIAQELGVSPDARRGRYRVVERTPRGKPEPPPWFMPSVDDELSPSPVANTPSSGVFPGIARAAANDDPSS